MKPVGEIIRQKREEKGWLLRHLAAKIDIDQALLSKIERGERRASKEQIEKLACELGLNKEELMLQFLSENIAYEIADEENALEVLQVAEGKVEYLRKKKRGNSNKYNKN
jgi:transcriptional regulator with XRE-family HTH domain